MGTRVVKKCWSPATDRPCVADVAVQEKAWKESTDTYWTSTRRSRTSTATHRGAPACTCPRACRARPCSGLHRRAQHTRWWVKRSAVLGQGAARQGLARARLAPESPGRTDSGHDRCAVAAHFVERLRALTEATREAYYERYGRACYQAASVPGVALSARGAPQQRAIRQVLCSCERH